MMVETNLQFELFKDLVELEERGKDWFIFYLWKDHKKMISKRVNKRLKK
jgi:hypothetical protein